MCPPFLSNQREDISLGRICDTKTVIGIVSGVKGMNEVRRVRRIEERTKEERLTDQQKKLEPNHVPHVPSNVHHDAHGQQHVHAYPPRPHSPPRPEP